MINFDWADHVAIRDTDTVLESDLRPDLTLQVESPEVFFEALGTLLPYWPVHRWTRPPHERRRHPWAWWHPACEALHIQCQDCRTRFLVQLIGKNEWQCECTCCAEDAGSVEDGVMPPCGVGESPLEAAQNWSDAS